MDRCLPHPLAQVVPCAATTRPVPPARSTSLSLVSSPLSPVDVALVLAPARAKVLGSQCVELLRSLDGLEAEVAQPPLLVVPASTWNAILLLV